MALKGNAGFKWTPPGGSLTTHTLNAPLRQIRPAESKVRFDVWSLDLTSREVVTVGSGVAEITAMIRYDDDAPELLSMLSDGAEGVTLTYYPDLDVTGTNYPCQLVYPSGDEIQLAWDRHRGVRKEWEIEVRLRRVDGGTFDGLVS